MAQRTRPCIAARGQPAFMSALRAPMTQLTYAPWLSAPSHGHCWATAAAMSLGHDCFVCDSGFFAVAAPANTPHSAITTTK
jgi:hypothetical protein